MPKFSVGEIALIKGNAQSDPKVQKYVGGEVECVLYYGEHPQDRPSIWHDWWLVKSQDGYEFIASESILVKRKPPEEKGSWEEIEKLLKWNPTKVKRPEREPVTASDIERWSWL